MSDPHQPPKEAKPPADGMTQRQTYNMISDTVIGVNVRLRDNIIQGIVILACFVVGAVIGAVAMEPRVMGALAGGLAGLVVGFFGTGVFLMVYRAVMHLRGRHD